MGNGYGPMNGLAAKASAAELAYAVGVDAQNLVMPGGPSGRAGQGGGGGGGSKKSKVAALAAPAAVTGRVKD